VTGVEQELIELERALWERAGDVAFYRARLTHDAVMVFPAPYGIIDREAVLEAVASATGWQDVELSDAVVVSLGDDAAVLAYRARAVRPGSPPYQTYATSAFVRRDGAWRLALHQQTPIPAESTS
jgi:hypothetical protein